ncbi:uncharacterized protein NECHADRAFT_95300 [Fusarium vanettenii 77-13-4]|uniref:Homoaconitate hydratase n=1 Tax=Fusarium vanettenii (strain ATCC MYA-4622 / CBS 123669 / FGSC 9596 / NRRL 45880 / 77-13-4) TaxID=660122 RepID=C7Z416_FUSV7|nr:uncharacterized protein NECHADRAFT_95300 [Fusarium vanettenii 77-13-4]EEU41237.1 hypothetical protein NECHADRAFT_95300 [Fusarium vanettenii 77-13-4]
MTPIRRAVALSTVSRLSSLSGQRLVVRSQSLSAAVSQFHAYSTSRPLRQQAFHSQLENAPNAADLLNSLDAASATAPSTPQTLTEKIVQRYSVGLAPGKKVKSGDYVTLQPAQCMTHDNSWPVALKMMSIGATQIKNPSQITLDHDTQNKTEANLRKYKNIQEFAEKHGTAFYPAGRGIGHQIMIEEGYAWPGSLAVASDSHSNIYGGIGCLGTPVVRTDAAAIWSTERTWWQIPPIAKITLTGLLPPGVTGKDVIVALCGLFNKDEVLNHAIEFAGSDQTMHSIPIDDRLTISNMTTEYGQGLVSQDGPCLVSCTNSRASDLAAAARVFREAAKEGKSAKVAPGVKFYVAAASILEQKIAEEAGDWDVLREAGAEFLPSGCGPCIGLGTGLLEEGEVGISASNRNFKGRMGSPLAKAYLASPEIVAASAIQGKIAGPGWYQKPEGVEKVIIGEGSGDHVADKALSIEDALDKIIAEAESMIAVAEKDGSGAEAETAAPASEAEGEGEETLTDIIPGFPEKIEGEIVFCDADNINRWHLSGEQMSEVCMENYDPEFRNTARAGDILVAGFNFGCGSSREQAATAILAKEIPLVVSGSFGNIFSRNSINNALLGVEVPRLVERLRETYKNDAEKPLTRRTGWKLLWDLRRSKVVVTEKNGETWSQKVGEMPPNVQEIIARGGLEKWVKAEIEK